jgi:thiol-disulfide isomerase/thioredoxin
VRYRWIFGFTAIAVLGSICGPTGSVLAADAAVTTPDGRPVVWSQWADANAPVAVILWASWTPGARATLDELPDLESAARERGLSIVVVSVQETLEDARRGLDGVDQEWLHDRYGGLLKQYRVVSIPAMLILSDGDRVSARLKPTVDDLRLWKDE